MDWPKGYLKIRCISFGFLECLLPCASLPCALAVSFSTFSSRDWSQQSGADIVTQKQEHDKAAIHLFRCFAGPLKVKCVDYEKSIFSKQFPFEFSVMQRKDEVKIFQTHLQILFPAFSIVFLIATPHSCCHHCINYTQPSSGRLTSVITEYTFENNASHYWTIRLYLKNTMNQN